jgi:hypothetical protein
VKKYCDQVEGSLVRMLSGLTCGCMAIAHLPCGPPAAGAPVTAAANGARDHEAAILACLATKSAMGADPSVF